MRRRGHAPFRRTVLVHHRRAGDNRGGSKGGVPEHLLSNLALGRNRAGFTEGHALGCWRGVFLQPLNGLGHRIDRRRVVGRAATGNTGADGLRFLVHPNAPFIDGQPVRLALVAHSGHRHPRVGIAPAERWVFLAIVHVAKDRGRPAHVGHIAPSKECGDILIGRPVDRNPEVIAIGGFEIVLGLLIVEPVIAEPVQVGELLVGQLVKLAIWGSGERQADEVGQIEAGVGYRSTLASHPVGQAASLLIAPVSADQIRVVDISIKDVLARLHLGLNLFDHVAFAHDLMCHFYAGNGGERRSQHLRFVHMGVDTFGRHFDFHADEGFGGIDEPLHFGFLIGAAQRRQVSDLSIEERLCSVHVSP